jgi:hypothetical protein
MNLTLWSTEQPARAGWYNASLERSPDARRYWNGAQWSAPCYADDPQSHFDRARRTVGETQAGMEWRGLTEGSAAWLSAELEREPLTA